MITKLGLVLVLLAQAPAGLAAGEFMLCFHRDGRIEVERFDLLCCNDKVPAEDCGGDSTPANPSSCPDDLCQDVPLTVGAIQSLDTPTSIERLSEMPPSAAVIFMALPEEPAPDFGYSALGAGPPRQSGAREHLRTIVLRI